MRYEINFNSAAVVNFRSWRKSEMKAFVLDTAWLDGLA